VRSQKSFKSTSEDQASTKAGKPPKGAPSNPLSLQEAEVKIVRAPIIVDLGAETAKVGLPSGMYPTREEPDQTLRHSGAERPSEGGGSPSGADIQNLVDAPTDAYTAGAEADLLLVPTKRRATAAPHGDANFQSVLTPSFDELGKLAVQAGHPAAGATGDTPKR